MMRGNSKLRSEMLFGDASSEAFLCVYVGRISKEKRLDVIVEAVKNIPNAYLAIIGDGPSAPFYAAVHGKESRIYCKPRFLTHAELARVYASADVHVSASQFETLGNTVLEAFACGIPVVVPRCQGFCDTVADKLDGYLFAPGNSSSAQEFIQLLKDDPMHRSKMGEHGRLVVSSHTVSHVVKDLVAWYVRGINRKEETALFTRFCALCVLLVTVPIAIIALWCYERLVSISINIRHVMPVARVLQVRGMKEYCQQFKPYCATLFHPTILHPVLRDMSDAFDSENNIVYAYSSSLVLLLVRVPSSFLIFQPQMDLLLVVCGYSPVENHPTAHTPPHSGVAPAAVALGASSPVDEASTPSDVTDGERKEDDGADSPGILGNNRIRDEEADKDGDILRLRKKEKGVEFSGYRTSAGSTSPKDNANNHISSYGAAGKSQ